MSKQVRLSFKADADRPTVSALIELLERTLTWLRSLDPKLQADWTVLKVTTRHPFALVFENPQANGNVTNRMRGLSRLAYNPGSRCQTEPIPTVSDEEIESAKDLVNVLEKGFNAVTISSPGEKTVRVTPKFVATVSALAKNVESKFYYQYTTLRGILNQVTVGENLNRFRITHQLTGAEMQCSFAPDLLDQVKDALPSMVEVRGKARFNKKLDQPISIDVTELRMLPAQDFDLDSLPAIDITGGLDSTEYVERVRSA